MPQALAMIALFGCVSRLYRGSYESEREVDNARHCNPAKKVRPFSSEKRNWARNEEVPLLWEDSRPFSAFPLPRTHMQLPNGEPARKPSTFGRLLALVQGCHKNVHENLSSEGLAQW